MIQLESVHKSFGRLQVLQGIDLTVAEGEVVALIGPSGSGKSTILRCINALEQVDKGRVIIEGKSLQYHDRRLIREVRQKVGIVFQSFNLFPHMSALDNVTVGPKFVLGMSKRQAEELAVGLLRRVGVEDKARALPDELSGGQQQRVAIARSLALQPKAMLFDEVTSALDPELTREVLDVMRALADQGMTMVVVSHEMGFVREVADRLAFIEKGRILETAPPAELFDAPKDERVRSFLAKIL